MSTLTQAVATLATTSATPQTTSPFTPVTGDLLVVALVGVASVDSAPTCTASANGITFVRAINHLWGGNDTMAVFVSEQKVGSSPVSMTVTCNTPSDPTGGTGIVVWRVSDMILTGTSAVRQTATSDPAAGATPSAAFVSSPSSANPIIGVLGCSTNPPNLTPPTNFTEYADAGWSSPTSGIHMIGRNSGHTATSVVWGSTCATASGIILVELDSGPGIPSPGVVSSWVGAPQATSMAIVTKVQDWGTDQVKIRYSVNSDMSGSTDTAAASPDARGVNKFSISSLTANTRYYYKIVVGTTVLDGGDFKTMVSGSSSFAFGYASCRNSNTDSTAFVDVLTRTHAGPNASFFLQIGDLHYEDISTEDSTLRRNAYDEFLSKINARDMVAKLPTDYVYDDHDSCGNNANSTDTGWTTTASVYRERVPHFTLQQSTGVEHTFVIGRVRFIVLDGRTYSDSPGSADGPTKTRLGATQKAWFINLLQTATEALIFVVSTMPWIGPVAEAGGNDHWGMYPNERDDVLAPEIQANGRVVILSGDQHCLAYDDGTNSPGGCPVWHAAALNRTATFKGGPYSGGQSTGGPHQYGFVDVVDTGSTITATWRGIQSDGTVWKTTSFSPDAPVDVSQTDSSGLTDSVILAKGWGLGSTDSAGLTDPQIVDYQPGWRYSASVRVGG